MKLRFGEEFVKRLKTIGETVIIGKYTLTEKDTPKRLESLWNEDRGCLEITFDLTEEENVVVGDNITVYCTDHNGFVSYPAFYIEAKAEELCWGKGKNRRDLNYITVYLPTPITANIETRQTKDQVNFIEEDAIILGYSAFITRENNRLLTRNSVRKYSFLESSVKNDRSVYLNQNGEIVAEVVSRKVYKKLVISAPELNGVEDSDGNITYYVGKGSTHKITAKSILDLYKNDNGLLSLLRKDTIESVTDISLEGIGSDFTIDQSNNTITFKDGSTVEEVTLTGRLEFLDENDTLTILTSNTLKFITYLDTLVEYSTDLSEQGVPLFLFDNQQNSMGWNPSNTLPAKISVYVRSATPISKNSIRIESDNQAIFSRYFKHTIEEPTYDRGMDRWKCSITLTTAQINSSADWFPLDFLSDGKSKLVKSYVYVEGNIRPESAFYCVQKGTNKLQLYFGPTLHVPGQAKKYTGPGITTISGVYLSGSAEGYSKWEASIISGKNTALSTMSGDISESSTFSFFLSSGDASGMSSKVRFRRLSDQMTYSRSNWKDLIYCNDDDGILEIDFVSQEPIQPSDSDLFVLCKTNYFYTSTSGDSYGLLVFPREGGEKTITIYSKTENLNFFSGSRDFSNHFRYQKIAGPTLESGKYVTKVKITADSLANLSEEFSQYSWWPKTSNGEPTNLTIMLGEELSARAYVVYSPTLTGTLGFEDKKGKAIDKVVFEDNEGRKEVRLDVVSTKTEADLYYPYWYCVSHDPEIGYTSPMSGGFGPMSVYTDVRAKNSESVDFDPFIIRRVKQKYTSTRRLIEDWENQLSIDSEKALELSLYGNNPSKSISVVADMDKGMLEVDEKSPIELTYIGLYKIFIKSNGRFRVRLSDTTNESEGLYFYNKGLDKVEDGLSMIDFGSFSEVTGTEVCLYYKGGEESNFWTKDKFFDTKLIVTNLETGTIRSIKFHRTYFIDDSKSVLNLYSGLIHEDNGESVKLDNKHYVTLVNRRSNLCRLNYKSFIETSVDIISSGQKVSVDDISRTVLTNYGGYEIVRDSEIGSAKIKKRGYTNSTTSIKFNQQDQKRGLPLRSVLSLNLKSTDLPDEPENLPGEFKNQFLNYRIFSLYDINPIVGPDSVGLEAVKGSKGEIEIVLDRKATTTLHYKTNESTEVTSNFEEGETYNSESSILNLFRDKYTITQKVSTEADTFKVNIKVVANEDYITGTTPEELQKPSEVFLTVEAKTYLKRDKLFDPSENIPSGFVTQGDIDRVAIPAEKTLKFWRYGLEQSKNSFVNDKVDVSEFGGKYSFVVNKKISSLELSYPESLRIPQIEKMEFSGKAEVLPTFRNRLYTWYDDPIEVVPVGGSGISEGTKEWIKRVSTKIPVNFSILVGNEEDQPGDDTITTENVQQLGWKKGLKIGNKIFLSHDNVINLEPPLNYNAGEYILYAGSVGLSESGTLSQDSDTVTIQGSESSSSMGSSDPTQSTYGNKFVITVPENENLTTTKTGSFTVSDEYGNSVVYNYKVSPKRDFTVEAYSDELCTNKLTGEDNRYIKMSDHHLNFDASGKLISSPFIYVKSEGSDLAGSFRLSVVENTIKFYDEERDKLTPYSYETLQYRFTAEGERLRQLPDGKFLYKLKVTGRITGFNDTSNLLRLGFTATVRIGLEGASESSSALVPNSKFGYARVTITPRETFRSEKYWDSDLQSDIEDTITYVPVYNSEGWSYNPTNPNYIDPRLPIEGVEQLLSGTSNMEDSVIYSLRKDLIGKDFCHTGFYIKPYRREWYCEEREEIDPSTHHINPVDLHIVVVTPDGTRVDYTDPTDYVEVWSDYGGFRGPSITQEPGYVGFYNVENARFIHRGEIISGDYTVYIERDNNNSLSAKIIDLTFYIKTGKGNFNFNLKEEDLQPGKMTPIATLNVDEEQLKKVTPLVINYTYEPIPEGSDSISTCVPSIKYFKYEGKLRNVSSWKLVDLLIGDERRTKFVNRTPSIYKLGVMLSRMDGTTVYADNLETVPPGASMPTSREYSRTYNIRAWVDSGKVNNCSPQETLGESSLITQYGEVVVLRNTAACFVLEAESTDFSSGYFLGAEILMSTIESRSLYLEDYGDVVFKFIILSKE